MILSDSWPSAGHRQVLLIQLVKFFRAFRAFGGSGSVGRRRRRGNPQPGNAFSVVKDPFWLSVVL